MTNVLGWECESEQEVNLVSKMRGFGIVYTLDMGPHQLWASKIHSNFGSCNKITKFWQCPSFQPGW